MVVSDTPPDTEADPTWRDLVAGPRALYLSVLFLGVLLHAMNTLLMSTVLPSAVLDVGGVAYMSWATSIFMIASVTAAAGAARLKASLGGRRAYALSAALFFLGTTGCGLAPDMATLIAGRFVQGAGGGLLAALGYALVGNLFPKALWPRIFALMTGAWGVASLSGPLIGGIAAGAGEWRAAFFAVAALAFALTVIVLWRFPRDLHDTGESGGEPYPALRLSLVALTILAMSVAATRQEIWLIAALLVLGIGAFIAMMAIDRRATAPILPSDAFSLSTVTGLGLWIAILLAIANDPFAVFGPLFMQTIHGFTPLQAGYMVAGESMAWTASALVVASLPYRWSGKILVAGPVIMGCGLAGIAIFLPHGPALAVIPAIALLGMGIGVCWTFLTQRVMSHAKPGEMDVAAAAIPTIQLIGLALGAALAGLVANMAGLAEGITFEAAVSAAMPVHAFFVPIAWAAAIAALRLHALERPGDEGA